MREIVCFEASTTCEMVLAEFQKGSCHVALIVEVRNNNNQNGDPELVKTGLVSLEDIIEEILDEEIEDEMDNKT